MGALGAAMTAYAQPLVDQTDGSPEQIHRALQIAMLCWNMALVPDADHDEFLEDIAGTVRMGKKKFATFRRDVIDPMIRRHREMFPEMNPRRREPNKSRGDST